MQFIKNLSIKIKMRLGFGTILLILTVFGYFIISQINEFGTNLKSLDIAQNKKSIAKDVQFDIQEMRQYITRASLTKENKFIEKFKKSFVKTNADLDKLIVIEKNNLSFASELKKTKGLVKKMSDISLEMFNAHSTNSEVDNLKMTDFDVVSSTVIERTKSIVKKEKVIADKLIAEIEAKVSSDIGYRFFNSFLCFCFFSVHIDFLLTYRLAYKSS